MRTATLLLLLLLPFSILASGYEADPGLEISFRLFDRDLPVKDYTIVIFKDGNRIDSSFARKDKTIYLLLDLNSNYMIRIDKKGFRERLMMADTKVPSGMEKGNYTFYFDVTMVSDSAQANTKADLPVVLISWSETEGGFSWSVPYAESVGHLPEVSTSGESESVPKPKKGIRSIFLCRRRSSG